MLIDHKEPSPRFGSSQQCCQIIEWKSIDGCSQCINSCNCDFQDSLLSRLRIFFVFIALICCTTHFSYLWLVIEENIHIPLALGPQRTTLQLGNDWMDSALFLDLIWRWRCVTSDDIIQNHRQQQHCSHNSPLRPTISPPDPSSWQHYTNDHPYAS